MTVGDRLLPTVVATARHAAFPLLNCLLHHLPLRLPPQLRPLPRPERWQKKKKNGHHEHRSQKRNSDIAVSHERKKQIEY
jgi:hypothetical protein